VDSPRGGHLARRPAIWRLIRSPPPPRYHHLMDLMQPLSPSRPHLRPACRTIWKLRSVGNFMAPCRSPQQSHPLLSNGAPKAEHGRDIPHSLLCHFLHQLSLVPILLHPSWSVLHSATRTSGLRLIPLLLLRVIHPRPTTTITMPRLRGKSKRGAAWYAARGREAPISDPPPESEAIPVLAPIIAPTPAEPLHEATPDLSPLSNPYDCRIEWFDTLGNSLGYVPPPPSPPRRPPPPPSPSRHRVVASSAPSPLPSSSSDSPLPPHSAPPVTGALTEKRSWLHCVTSTGVRRKSSLHFSNCRRRMLNAGVVWTF
jgi:hypothetical protein